MLQQQPRRFRIIHGPKQRRRAGIVADVRVRALVQQQANGTGIPVECRIHQWCGTAGALASSGFRTLAQQLFECDPISAAERVHQLRGLRVLRRRRRFSR